MNEINHTDLLELKTVGDVWVVSFKQASIGGIGSVENIAGRLRELVQGNEGCKMVVDFSNVCFFSSQMLGLLVDLWRRMKDRGGTLLISGINPQMTRVFRITHLDKLFQFYEDTDAALASLGPADSQG